MSDHAIDKFNVYGEWLEFVFFYKKIYINVQVK